MEALGAAASIAQFAALSLKCVKEVHNALAAIKDGPAGVQLLAGDFLLLQDILQRLDQSRVASDNPALDRHIQQSIEALCSRAEKIVELQTTPADRTGIRFWKRLKVVVSENDIDRIRSETIQLVGTLNLRINGILSNSVSNLKDDGLQTRQTVQSMNDSVQVQFQSQATNFLALEKFLTANNERFIGLQGTLSSIQQTVGSTSSISDPNSSCLVSLLKDIKNIVASKDKGKEKAVDESDGSQNQAMLESIDRLCALIDEKRDAVDIYAEDDELAESAIDDLQTLLSSFRGRKRPKLEYQLQKGLRRLGRSFGQNKLFINSLGVENGQVAGIILDQERFHEEADVGVGTVSLVSRKRKRTILQGNDRSTAISSQGILTDYKMSMSFLPNGEGNQHMLVASLIQREVVPGGVTSISRLQVNRVLPDDSPVFKLVKEGKLQDLLRMLQNGEASLRDHDERGASLLFYSLMQPEMCKFLLEEGLDVDHVTSRKFLRDWRTQGMTPFLQACIHNRNRLDMIRSYLNMGANIHDRTNEGETCLHLVIEALHSPKESLESLVLLLQKGADPHARDNQGISVSDMAYNMTGTRGELLESYGDIWDAALHTCGYDIAHFRSSRRPRYDPWFTREDFEKLWIGKEDQCPYWNDKPWSPSGTGDDESDSVERFCTSDFETSEDEDQSENSYMQDEWLGSEDEDGGALL
ncbi:hypothetical protein F53441_10302 [Fusarium austroafricanum]|uniref:Azaphilone pigments biosynthesis cluster protein L N-terminal domain-containing protein n=1 Tax=Fusarium austroafricanum TaxID=2364996 RepID=A0A8H4NVI5_9HYPO|nr:hypothetical protein F53441_10302 [Fusarium austroafricanum]